MPQNAPKYEKIAVETLLGFEFLDAKTYENINKPSYMIWCIIADTLYI